MTLGERIGYMRKAKGLTQEALSEMMDVTPQAVSKWECSQSCPDIMALPKLAGILGCTIDELLTGEKPEIQEVKELDVVEPEVVDFEVPAVIEPESKDRMNLDSIEELEISVDDSICKYGKILIERGDEESSLFGSVLLMERENGRVYMELEEGSEFHLVLSKDSRLENLSIETVASEVRVDRISLKKLTVDTVSGQMYIMDTKVEAKADLNTVSGTIRTDRLNVDKLDVESVSGDVYVNCDAKKRIGAGTVSGKIHLESCFTKKVTVETVTGNAVVFTGNSSPDIHFDSMMGELEAENYPKPHDMEIVADTVSGKIKVRTVKYM